MAEKRRSATSSPMKSGTSIKSEDSQTYDLLQHVFSEMTLSEEASAKPRQSLELENLQSNMDEMITEVVEKSSSTSKKKNILAPLDGRIGPLEVVFDQKSIVGTMGLRLESDQLAVTSHSNFSTVRANCCVYRGKWMYEVMLWSKGVMQLGWCTIKCKFSFEEGVGDTQDSYSYDGSRLRKWNIRTQKYGEAWLAGDVITCALDCDNKTMTFYRNGKSMGEAFTNVKTGSGYAYFPAVSLSRNEHLRANFGATPLRYPIEGYAPLQAVPQEDVFKGQLLIGWQEKLVNTLVQEDKHLMDVCGIVQDGSNIPPLPLGENRSKKSTAILISAHIFDKLAPLLGPYVVECCLLPLMLKFCAMTSDTSRNNPQIIKLLDLMWSLMQDHEIKPCIDNMMTSLLYNFYKTSPCTSDFSSQKTYLDLTLRVLQHAQTRRYLLFNVLFDKIKFPVFMHVKPPDDAGLEDLVPTVWWATLENDEENPLPPSTDSERDLQRRYKSYCQDLRVKVEELEDVQIEILKVLLTHSDPVEKKTSRMIFIEKLRAYLKSNNRLGKLQQVTTCPLSFFHRLVQALRFYWDDFQREDPSRFVTSQESFMPIHEFWMDSRELIDFQRCGGLVSHLNRVLGGEVNKCQGLQIDKDGKPVRNPDSSTDYPPLEMPSGNSLMDLLDVIVLLYRLSSHAQISKMCSLRDNLKEFVTSLRDTEMKLDLCPEDRTDMKLELERALKVFQEKYEELARQMAWLISVVYSPRKQEDVGWLLGVALRTVEKASSYGQLFQYTPEFYVESVIRATYALHRYFHPIVNIEELKGYDEMRKKFALFLVRHFADARIVNTDLRDNIVQALACFICYPKSLKALEGLPQQIKESMMKSLIAPYESRSWAQTNWILVRIWKGCGFGFRYTHLSHLVPSKVQPTEFGSASLQEPCPSIVLQNIFRKMLLTEQEASTRFLDTLINQLNWSFSEFIGLMQEIQQQVSRTELRILEARTLKICATCFEIAVCLMRVLEMIVCVAPETVLDFSRQSSELLLGRLMQLLCHVLNRVTSRSGVFSTVISHSIQGLEGVSYYPILAVTIGVLHQLVMKSTEKSQKKVLSCLLSDPAFQIPTLEFTLGVPLPQTSASSTPKGKKGKEKIFNFETCEEMNESETQAVRDLISFIKEKQENFQEVHENIKEEDLCTICYANSISAVFKPCGHQSCRTCISHQMMGKKECFFCKVIITAVDDLQGQQILTNSTPGSQSNQI
ncbi:E3 ubiquitin-protein ligase RNF123-like isoform X2 [Ostrea edulis]|uniref:E3 ubiquitin-protein ligase RNF123-like isoform X2 n=1 Tax=Ostrea edulis TaxID=37623 RepID=UPI0024AFDE10|nr:E3 ubiquitin-protein ligase RNF123-like isoform X2 [Ostrea edulis]